MTDFRFRCDECKREIEMAFEGSIDGGAAAHSARREAIELLKEEGWAINYATSRCPECYSEVNRGLIDRPLKDIKEWR